MPVRFNRPIRLALVVMCACVLSAGLLPAVGEAQPKLTLAQVQARIAALQTQAEVSQEALNTAQVAIASGRTTLGTIKARVVRSQAGVERARVLVGRLASAAYRSGGVDQTLQLLLADNPTQFLDQAAALDTVTRRQADVFRQVRAAQQRLAQDKLAAAQQVGRLQQLGVAAARGYADVRTKIAQAQALFNSLKASEQAAILRQQALARAQAVAAARAAAQAAAAQAAARAAAARPPSRHSSHPVTGKPSKKPAKHPVRHPVPRPPPSPGGSIGARVVAFALRHVGDSYVWGASGPSAWDCSGLTMKAYASVGVSLPHSSSAQSHAGRRISAASLQPGDLVFYYSPIHHVGIYIGGGMIVHAANPGAGVTTDPVFSMPLTAVVRPY